MKMNIKRTLGSIKNFCRRNAPTIMVGLGIAGGATGTILACRATLKAKEAIDISKKVVPRIEIESDENARKKKLRKHYIRTGFNIAKHYAVPVALLTASGASIISGHKIQVKRYVGATAALTATDAAFKAYRKNVKDIYGEDADKALAAGSEIKKVLKEYVDPETGEVKQKEVLEVKEKNTLSSDTLYRRYFYKYKSKDKDGNWININPYWEPCKGYNRGFLELKERQWNQTFIARGTSRQPVTLFEIDESLGLLPTKDDPHYEELMEAEHLIGWLYDPNDSGRDNYISFKMYEATEDEDGGIWIEYNAMGNIFELMKKEAKNRKENK